MRNFAKRLYEEARFRLLCMACIVAPVMILAGCSSANQVETVAGLQTLYVGYAQAEDAYAKTPGYSPAIVVQAGVYRAEAYAALLPLEQAAECQAAATTASVTPACSVITAAEMEAAQEAVTVLGNYLTSEGVKN